MLKIRRPIVSPVRRYHVTQQLTQSRDTDGFAVKGRQHLVYQFPHLHLHLVTFRFLSPIRTKWSDSDSDDEAQRRRISYLDSRIASDRNITLRAASVKAGGIKSPYYTFRRYNSPPPEESAVRVTQEEVVGVPRVDGRDAVGGKVTGEESQLTFHVDENAKLTNDGDSSASSFKVYYRVTAIGRSRLARTTRRFLKVQSGNAKAPA